VGRVAEKPLRVHLALALAEAVCASAFVVELTRADSGNTLSWAYVFEWPVLGAYAVYVWRKLRRGDPREPPPPPTEGESAALESYNQFLDEVHRGDHPDATDR
jgi:hypothetical protein